MALKRESGQAVFRCAHGCGGEYSLEEIIYVCPECGGLLQVCHDRRQLETRSGEEWRALFDERRRSAGFPLCSGVWGKKEWVLPSLPDEHIVSLGEGWTPLLPGGSLAGWLGAAEVWIKQCGLSATGSFKDLGMSVLVSQVKSLRALGMPIRAVACASTGDTSAALAAYCAAAGIPAVVLLPENKISTAQLLQPLAHGALTIALQTDFDGCMRVVRDLTQHQEIYLANSMNSLRIEGQKTIALEICQQLGWRVPDWVVVPGGNLGNISAIWQGFAMARDLGVISHTPRLVCAQAEQANPFYRSFQNHFNSLSAVPAGETLATAIRIGAPVSIHKAIRAIVASQGVVEQASEAELAEAAVIADRCGFYACPQTGVALAAARKLIRRGEIRTGDMVVVISTAHGLKFSEFKEKYHTGALAAAAPVAYANRPKVLPARAAPILDLIRKMSGGPERPAVKQPNPEGPAQT